MNMPACPLSGGFTFQVLADLLSRYRLVHDMPGRMRLRPRVRLSGIGPLPLNPPLPIGGVEVTISATTGSVLIVYSNPMARSLVLNLLVQNTDHHPASSRGRSEARKKAARAEIAPRGAHDGPASPIPAKIRSWFYPRWLVWGISILRALPYIFRGLKFLLRGRLNLDVLDGAALLVCLLRRDFKSLSSITFFFALGEYLADKVRKKTRESLAESLSLNISHVWVRKDGREHRMPLANIRPGDHVVARAGAVLPVDGVVAEGEGMVNQSSMTGEALPVPRSAGHTVWAGSILEEGELVIAASRVGGDTRIQAILRAVESSETAKSALQARYERMADAIVPYNFLLSGLVYAASRDPARAGSVLLVDYSCAIRLATPLTVFTAMREGADNGILIKGGKFLEAAAEADTVVFDKTGTLTEARPVVAGVVPFGDRKRDFVLRLAACLEEHFAHPVGRAVVRAAEKEGLRHREEHARVDYIVAHGIASTWRGKRVLIGSEHFVTEDGGVPLEREQRAAALEEAAHGRSVLYLAIGGELAGLILIEDKLRENAAAVVSALREDGVRRIVMLTGDGERTAAGVAARLGIDEYRARLLPDDKAACIEDLKKQSSKVLMVGDGVNDAQALSSADVGVAMSDGADMAREVADIVLTNGNLEGLLALRRLSRLALGRIRNNLHVSLLCNSLFLAGGMLGLFTPGFSALLHNATTASIAVRAVRPLLPALEERHP
ncbi:MAG: heavy metal translocating P-type ATPase [Desulfovibrio sp.]|jgi:Cu2+-exporting ATPase|nr:heavy metal translocating P-type ATPase [Desulfovibrio sp.]